MDFLDESSTEEMRNEILCLRQENENLRSKIAYLEDELRECYERINIDKIPDYNDWLENDYNDDELDSDYEV